MKDVRALIIEYLKQLPNISAAGVDQLTDDTHLMESGLIDSFGFLEMILYLEEKLKINIDFSAVPPEKLADIRGLVHYLGAAEQ